MGWVWSDDEDDRRTSSRDVSEFGTSNPRSEERCSTRKVVKSQCRTEEVEPGKFVKKCEKTEEILRDCIGKPVEVIQSNKEFTEEDVTDVVQRGGSFTFGSSGLQSDIEAIERNLFGGLSRFFDAAEEMKNGFFDAFARAPHIFDEDRTSSPSVRKGIPIDEYPPRGASPKPKESEPIGVDLSALAKDV
ncbi:Mal D 1-associated protein [Senna tora]|uniref:Mal D 1-associated protein n=1 Tax=Senna tora TaxID=362788 RepID=A0A834TB28_9FABA|nr:Mal D 1-associated protein [Senna tora]